MYIILVNDGIFGGDKAFRTEEEVRKCISEWSNGEVLLDENEEEVSFEDLLLGSVDIWNESMVERGDDYVSVEVRKLRY